MSAIRLGLIGHHIAHSQSPQVYRRLLGQKIDYHLFDFKRKDDIPPLKELFSGFDGLSVTAPYKNHFFPEVNPSPIASSFKAINCIKKKGNEFMATLTDYSAVSVLLDSIRKSYKISKVFILGSGIMANISARAMKKRDISFNILSRKKTKNFDKLDLENKSGKGILIINACAREYAYNKKLNKNTLFWDYNYNLSGHAHLKELLGKNYIDGMGLLCSQAKYSVEFWDLKF